MLDACLGDATSGERIRSKSSVHCRKSIHRVLFTNCDKATPTGVCLVNQTLSSPGSGDGGHPCIIVAMPTAPPESLHTTWWRNLEPAPFSQPLLKVETRVRGVENRLSAERFAALRYVILTLPGVAGSDDRARLPEESLYGVPSPDVEKYRPVIFSQITNKLAAFCREWRRHRQTSTKRQRNEPPDGEASLSSAPPFVISGRELITVTLPTCRCQFKTPPCRYVRKAPSFTRVVRSIGYLGFTFMIPIAGAYLASSVPINPFARRFWFPFIWRMTKPCSTHPDQLGDSSARCYRGWRLASSSSGSMQNRLGKTYNFRCSV